MLAADGAKTSEYGAKTSEYKYFKKLCEEAGHKCCSYQVPVQEINLKTSNERDVVASTFILDYFGFWHFKMKFYVSFVFPSSDILHLKKNN